MKKITDTKIGIIGLGYVGLPLAIEFGKRYKTFGFDINKKRILDLRRSKDINSEFNKREIIASKKLFFTNDSDYLKDCNFYVVTVPTPIKKNYEPDLRMLKSASRLIGKLISKNNIVVFESTVYPGATEEVCVPIIEIQSKLKANKDFFYGYSPERINPGDKKNTLRNIIKIVSGSNSMSKKFIKKIYESILKNKTHLAKDVRTAEAAKVIENIQRDVNIALTNEFSNIFNRLGIDTQEVLKAASTKWNFIKYSPGIVGGHCIGVDPYYLAHKSKKIRHNPKIILSGRSTNENMPKEIVRRLVILLKEKKILISNASTLVLGFSFKENCSDTRNTKVLDLILLLLKKEMKIDVFDPLIQNFDFKKKNLFFKKKLVKKKYDLIILAVPHSQFLNYPINKIKKLGKKNHILYDIKGSLSKKFVDGRL